MLPDFTKTAWRMKLSSRMRSDEFGGKGKLLHHEISVCHSDGHDIPVRFSGGIIYDKDKEIATFGIFTDLRAMLKIEEDLEQTHNMLMQSEKMAGLGRLAAGVAHEINNPMSGIMLYANLIMEDLDDNDHAAKEDLQTIIHEAERCKVIVADLLEFSHQTSYEMEPLDLNEVVQKTLGILKNQPLYHNIEVVLTLREKLPPTSGQFYSAQPGCDESISQRSSGHGRQWHDVYNNRTRANNGINEILIKDSGPGIPEDLLEKIFEPFFTTKTTGEGTGLGLSVSYAIVKEHKGTIKTTSAVGEGTTFTLTVPGGCGQLKGRKL